MGGLITLDDWLNWQENLHIQEIDLGLKRIQTVYSALFPNGVPFSVITVAGTNGKGSTISFIDHIYQQSDYKSAKFTSPHIINYNERFTINGINASDQQIIQAFEKIEAVRNNTSLTYFEFSTLAALLIFASEDVDIAILEVGLGGRLDSVNVVDCDIAVITNIAIDHVEYLGNTRELIGHEKSGIMRSNIPCVCGDQNPPNSINNYADKIGAPLKFVQNPYTKNIGLIGSHQQQNAALAKLCVETLNDLHPISNDQIILGIQNTKFDARFQTINIKGKKIILDVAHNAAAIKVLKDELAKDKVSTVAIFSALKDKNIKTMINTISPIIDQWLLVPLSVNRATPINELSDQFKLSDKINACANMSRAIEQTLASPNHSRVVIFGSFHVVADALKILKQ